MAHRMQLTLVFLLVAALMPHPVSAAPIFAHLPDLATFTAEVFNDDPSAIRGVYAEGLFALPVIPQPPSDPGYVSGAQGSVTQFAMAAGFDVVGLLAHEDLSGEDFFQLKPGQRVDLVYGGGRTTRYRVTEIRRYKAIDPTSITSSLVDLDTQRHLSADALFTEVYRGAHHVTFQTCIPAPGDSAWGRLFVIAEPVAFPESNLPRG